MNFYDTITGMGYEISPLNDKEITEIVKSDKIVEIHIVFYKNDKKVLGYLKPVNNFYDVGDVSRIYTLFLEMKRDVKDLASRAKYDIIWEEQLWKERKKHIFIN